jgi:short-subunit dehydrogenase
VELSGTGVHVVCVCPGFTRTGFQEKAHIDVSFLPSFAWMSPEEVADQAVRAARRSGVLVNGMMNNLTTVFMRLAPRSFVARMVAASARGGV